MGLFTKLKEHAAVASGNFTTLFADVEIQPLPAALAQLVQEIGRLEPDTTRLEAIITSDPEFAANVLRTVNSSAYGLSSRVLSIKHAIALLGLLQIRSLAFSYVVVKNIPRPESSLFDQEAFWTDSLLRALLARELCRATDRLDGEEAYTATLLADVSLPVLLNHWSSYYEPVIEEWMGRPQRLTDIEQEHFGWDHGQATTWILRHWDFPSELACLAGAHNLSVEAIRQLGLDRTAALPSAAAALLPSVRKADPARCRELVMLVARELDLPPAHWPTMIDAVRQQFYSISQDFDIRAERAAITLDDLTETIVDGDIAPCPRIPN